MITSGIDWSSATYEEVRARHRWSIPPRFDIAAGCLRHADGSGRLALIEEDEDGRVARYTFDELLRRVDGFAGRLAELGVARGDRVAVFLPQRVENAVAHLATMRLGAISVPLSPLFRAGALEHRLGHSEAKVVVTDEEHAQHLPLVQTTVLTVERDAAQRGAPPPASVELSAGDPAMLIYTSGTSGLPKGALHAHRFVLGRLSAFELLHRLESSPERARPFWTPAEWAWVGGLVDCVLTPWIFGCPVLAYRRRRFDPDAALALIARHQVRSLFLPPTALAKLRSARPDPPRLDVFSVHTAGEPLSPELYEWATRAFGTVHELYGMTEMGATIGNSPFFAVRPGSMGQPYPGHEIALLGDEGEIAVRAPDPGMFLGYYRDPDATRARFQGEYFLTGDRAVRDADGYLYYRGRADDMFNTSGYRVGPTEIEATLESHPAVERAAVVGAPDPERGEIVKAFLVLRDGQKPSPGLAEEIQRHVKTRLAVYEYPRRIVFARELPVTVTGKVRRVELRAPGADEKFGIPMSELHSNVRSEGSR